MFPLHFSLFLFLTNHSSFLYSSSLALPSHLSSPIILSSAAMFALSNGPSRSVVWPDLLLSPFFHGGRISWVLKCHASLEATGTMAFKAGQHFWVLFSEAPTSFWPNGMWGKMGGGLLSADALKLTPLWSVNLLGRVSGNEPCCGNREKSACFLTHW